MWFGCSTGASSDRTSESSIASMNICILFDTIDAPWGGGNQFLKGLAAALSRMGHRVGKRPDSDTQVVLLNAHTMGANRPLRPRQVLQLKHTGRMNHLGRLIPEWIQQRWERRGPVLVHRVDGVAELVRGRRTIADEVQPAINRLTDHTIFQSEYCKASFAEHCGIVPSSSRVVLNGTDPRLFFPDIDTSWDGGPMRLIAASWSSNRRKGFADISQFSRLPGVELTFAGNWCPDIDPLDVKLAGPLNSKKLGSLMRASHAMVHAAWNEPCSNAIVEAMASGLPVIYRDSGGNRELSGEYGVAMSDSLSDTLDALRAMYGELREKVLADRAKFLIRRAAEEYLAVFRGATQLDFKV